MKQSTVYLTWRKFEQPKPAKSNLPSLGDEGGGENVVFLEAFICCPRSWK